MSSQKNNLCVKCHQFKDRLNARNVCPECESVRDNATPHGRPLTPMGKLLNRVMPDPNIRDERRGK